MGDAVDVVVKSSELGCGCFSNVWDRKSEKPAGKGQSLRPLDRVHRFRRVFLAKNTRRFIRSEIQFGELIDC